jgi:hypothetical protein
MSAWPSGRTKIDGAEVETVVPDPATCALRQA